MGNGKISTKITTKSYFFASSTVIKLIVESKLIMSILTKMINYIHFD
jgi:HKD family nuclease